MLGRYTLSADPCRPMRVERKIHMTASIQQLLERSAQAQAEEVGHSLSLSVTETDETGDFKGESYSGDDDQDGGVASDTKTTTGSLRGASPKRHRPPKHKPTVIAAAHALPESQEAETEGEQRALRALMAVFGEVSALRHRTLSNQKNSNALRNWEELNLSTTPQFLTGSSLFFRSIEAEDYLSDDSDSLWRTRPMVMHKVANPLHLHYLHWRLQHCAIPKADLLTPEAVALAQSSMPPARVIFHSSTQLPLDQDPSEPEIETTAA